MTGATVSIGLVGCGRIAERGYVRALEQARGIRLAAVADPVASRCANAAPGVPAFRSAAELVAAAAVDALVLATPAPAHLADARIASAAGLSVLIEKPPASTLQEARALAALTPAPWMAFNRRFEPALARLRATIPPHDPLELELDLRSRRRSWRPYERDDDVLLNLGPHPVDLVRWLTGAEPARVRAQVGAARASIEIELAGGRGRARVSCDAERPYREQVVVRAASRRVGRYSAGGLTGAVRAAWRADHPLVSSLARQLEAFARAVRGGHDDPLAAVGDGIAVMATLTAARRSALAGGEWEAVEGARFRG